MLKLVVLVCAFAAATASAPIYSPAFYSAPLAYNYAYNYPLAQFYNYRGPLSLAPGQPADILGADGRPLDTLEVNQERAAHIAAQTGLHLLKKRSISIAAAPLSLAAHFVGRPIAYTAPFPTGYIAPIIRPVTYTSPIVRHY